MTPSQEENQESSSKRPADLSAREVIRAPRDLPQVGEFVRRAIEQRDTPELPRAVLTRLARETIERAREEMASNAGGPPLNQRRLTQRLQKLALEFERRKPTRVINCAGALLHTNLGRAPFSEEFFRSLAPELAGYSNLEFDLRTGKRGQRGAFVADQLAELTGAPAALVVNNCAGALFLALNTLSNRRETLISRGELVQIGGGFRVPDIMRRAGVKLTEVGTTNITRLADYAGAVTEKTSLLLKVSLSNFSQRGFVDHTPISELCSLARRHNLAVVYDLGSGLAADPLRVGLQGQESLTSALAAGADIVCASGDKLLGGPQAGLVLGDTQAIAKLRKNPLYRTLRPDKITLALLGRILEQYLDGAWEEGIPLWRLAQRTESDLYELGRRIITAVGAEDRLTLEAVSARYGGGSLPDVELPSCAISFSGTHAPDTLARIFRELPRPVVGRIENERFLLDLRALLAEDEAALVVGLKSALKILSASQ